MGANPPDTVTACRTIFTPGRMPSARAMRTGHPLRYTIDSRRLSTAAALQLPGLMCLASAAHHPGGEPGEEQAHEMPRGLVGQPSCRVEFVLGSADEHFRLEHDRRVRQD